MKIVVIGGTGLIGSKLVAQLRAAGHEAVAASPGTGVDSVTGAGVGQALDGAQVLVDVSNAPSFEESIALAFFEAATGNLVAAARSAGVQHYIALSVVGTDRMQDMGYFRAKLVQERMIEEAGLPFTIVHATQFFEFIPAIADAAMQDGVALLSSGPLQPIAADDVATALAQVVENDPAFGTIEIAGPDQLPLAEFVQIWMAETGDDRPIRVNPAAPYFGVPIADGRLVPGPRGRIQPTRYRDWLAHSKERV